MIKRPRGTHDFTPEEMQARRRAEAAFHEVSRLFGFGEVSTPTFEHLELFTTKSGPGIVEELYDFKDKSGRALALRPELTAPVIRFYLEELRSRPKPLKVYYVGPCFRYEEPQKGRYREFVQYGAEVLGSRPLEGDVEVIALAMAALERAGLAGVQLRVGHIGVLRGLLTCGDAAKARILHTLDKRDFERLKEELAAADLAALDDTLKRLISLRGGPEVLDAAANLAGAGAKEALDNLRQIGEHLAWYGIESVTYDLGVVRGLEYYTGVVFEIDYPNLGAEKQVAGGGSYALAEVFGGEPLFATGFGMGLDRVVMGQEAGGGRAPASRLDAYVIPIGDEMRSAGYQVLRSLRTDGLSADIDLVRRGPSKCLDYANLIKARAAVLVGAKEWARNVVAIKHLDSGEQKEVAVADLPALLRA